MDCELGENLTIELDALLRKLVDEDGVLSSCFANSSVQANDPEGAEVALLFAAIHECVLARLNHTFLRLYERAVAKALIAFGQLLYFLMPAMTDDAALGTHVRGLVRVL